MTRSWDSAVFDAVYARAADPWQFRSSRYEAAKYRATLAALGRRRFRACFEAGCSIGIFTRQLAGRCARLLAADCADSALRQARATCARLPHVRFRQAILPDDWPRGRRFDLVVFSEILYFLSPADTRRAAQRTAASLLPGGLVVLVNYTGHTDTPQTGHHAAAGFAAAAGLARAGGRRHGRYRIDRLIAKC